MPRHAHTNALIPLRTADRVPPPQAIFVAEQRGSDHCRLRSFRLGVSRSRCSSCYSLIVERYCFDVELDKLLKCLRLPKSTSYQCLTARITTLQTFPSSTRVGASARYKDASLLTGTTLKRMNYQDLSVPKLSEQGLWIDEDLSICVSYRVTFLYQNIRGAIETFSCTKIVDANITPDVMRLA